MSKPSLYTCRYDDLDKKYGLAANKLISFVHREINANPEYEGLVKRDGHLWLKISKGEMAKRTNMDKKTVKLIMRPDKNKAAEVFIWEPFSSNKSQDNDIHIVRLNYGILRAIRPDIYPEGGGKNTLRRGKKHLEVGGGSPDTHIYTITPSITPSSLPSSTESEIKKKKPDKTTSKESLKITLHELKKENVMTLMLNAGCHSTRLDECYQAFMQVNLEKGTNQKTQKNWEKWIRGFVENGDWEDPVETVGSSSQLTHEDLKEKMNLKARGYVQEVLSNEPDYTATPIRDDMQKWNEGFYDPLFASVRPPDTLKAIESILTQLITGENHDNKSA